MRIHGQEHRYEWLANHLLYDDQDEIDQYKSKLRSTLSEINAIPQHVPIIIWTGDNSHEQTGVRFVLHLKKEKSNDIRLINSALAYKTQCSQPNIDYVPRSTGELPPEKLSLLYEKNRESQPLSREERKHFEAEWEELSSTKQEVLRIWGNGTITNVPANYYDGYILHTARKLHNSQEKRDYMKSARLIGEVIGHLNQYLDDQYIGV